MSDQQRELTPEQEAQVRRLLAEARAAEPVPTDVAARLDRVMVGLGEERGGIPPTPVGHVVAPAWRRRRATVLMVAAAAVVAIGVGLGQIVDVQSSGDADGGSGADSAVTAERAPSDDEAAPEGAAPNPLQERIVPGPGSGADGTTPTSSSPVGRVREASFTADVDQLRRALPDDAADGEFVQLTGNQLPPGYVLTGRSFDCAPAPWGDGVLVPVFFDGSAAVLAYRPVIGESQVVDLLQCGTAEPLRSTTLQAD